MDKKILLTLLITGIFTACQSSTDKEQIDYSTLETLQTEVALEITESEEFLPGQLQDVAVDSAGNILVSDWGDVSISQFDSEGSFVGTIAEEGNGPGELNEYFGMMNVGHDTLMVQQSNYSKEYFAKDTKGVYRFVRSYTPDGMSMMDVVPVAHKTDSTYYTKFTPRYRNMQQAAKNSEEYRNAILAETSLGGQIVQDSLTFLKKGSRHIVPTGNGYGMFEVPYRFDDHLALLEDGFLVARPDSNALFIFDDKAQLKKRIPFNVSPRPITDEDLEITLDYLPDNMSSNNIEKMESRIGETKPPYLDVWATDQIIWLQTSSDHKDNTELVLVNYDGEPIGKLTLENTKDIGAIRDRYIYTIHQDPERGNTVCKYEVEI